MSGRAGLAQPSLTREINGRLTRHPPYAALQLHNYRGILLELVLGRVERRCVGGYEVHVQKYQTNTSNPNTSFYGIPRVLVMNKLNDQIIDSEISRTTV